MAVLQYVHLDVFTDQPFAGNPLAVFLDFAGIDDRRMQRIANEMAFPETMFVFPPETSETNGALESCRNSRRSSRRRRGSARRRRDGPRLTPSPPRHSYRRPRPLMHESKTRSSRRT